MSAGAQLLERSGMGSGMLSIGRFFFRYRNQLFPIFFLLIFFSQLFSQREGADGMALLKIAGVLIALSGQMYRLLVIGYAYIRRGGLKGEVYAEKLVTEGFYAHSRNPMYFGNVLIAVGFSLLFDTLLIPLIVIPIFLFIYCGIILVEEDYLRNRFAQEYSAYEARVPRFFPRFKGVLHTIAHERFDYRTAFIKEYGTLCATLAGLTFILFWHRLAKARTANAFFAFFVTELLILSAYVLLRRMKKSQQRRERGMREAACNSAQHLAPLSESKQSA